MPFLLGIIGSSQVVEEASELLLIGVSATPPSSLLADANQLRYMGHEAQTSGTVAKAYFYALEIGSAPVHICIFSSSGTLLGVSPAINPNSEGGWTSVDWSGPTLTQGTTYIIGVLSNGYFMLGVDDTSPVWPAGYYVAMTYGSETNFSPDPFNQQYGDLGCYVTT